MRFLTYYGEKYVLPDAVKFLRQNSHLLEAYRIGESAADTTSIIQSHVAWRLTGQTDFLTPWIIVPQGFINSQLHNVPIRMISETGLLSGLAWVAVGLFGLIRRPPYSYAWWMMLAVCLLSGMYYFTWSGPLGVFWWLLVADVRKNGKLASSESQHLMVKETGDTSAMASVVWPQLGLERRR